MLQTPSGVPAAHEENRSALAPGSAGAARPPETVDRYQLLEQVGSGGMAQVYRARDTLLDREVAVKLLHPHLASREDSRRRFSREARAVAKLRHPNILEIYDFSGDASGMAFIVTEFIRGVTLERFVEETGFGAPSIAALAAHQVTAAVEHAHGLGIVHRDIKPGNVMVREDGVMKLMDFGIARIVDQGDRMTMTGALVGSPAYMAPEIIEGKEADARSDVFSLGTLLYWLVTGVLPFAAANTTAVLKRILDGSYEDPRAVAPEVPDALCALLQDALQRDPASRLASAGELRLRLEASLAEDGLLRPAEELARFFADPPGYRAAFRAALVARLENQARESLRARRTAKALGLVSRLVAVDPDNPEAARLLASVRSGKRRRRAVQTALAVAAVAAGAWAIARFRPRALAPRAPPPATATLAQPSHPAAVAPVPVSEGPPANKTLPAASSPSLPSRAPVHPLPRPALAFPRARAPIPAPAAPLPGRLRLFVQPYADVFVDGQRRASGVPTLDLELTRGPHTLRLVHPDCDPWERRIDVAADGDPLRVRLVPKPAWLSIRATPPDADVMVDGVFEQTARDSIARPIRVPMNAGPTRTVTVRVFTPGYRDLVREVPVRANAQIVVEAPLTRR